jgi:hypothetical protein
MLALALLLASCTRHPVKGNDLTGAWVARPSSVAMLEESFRREHPAPRLELSADGSFRTYDLPGRFVTRSAKIKSAAVDGSGVWRIGALNDDQVVALTFTEINNSATETTRYLYIFSTRERRWLYFYFNDADDGIGFEFEKENS